MAKLDDRGFLLLLVALTALLTAVMLPFSGALLWAIIASLVFQPLHARLLKRWPARRNLVALLTLLIIVTVVVLPTLILGLFLVDQASGFVASLQRGEIDFEHLFEQARHQLPAWTTPYLTQAGLTNLDATLARIGEAATNSVSRLAAQALGIGQSLLGFLLSLGIMLYVTFFFLRDGAALSARIAAAVPVSPDKWRALTDSFNTMIRATIKGSLVVAVLQGTLGGIIFALLGVHAALLWAVAMAVLAFLPVVGTALIWAPVAIYMLATGAIWQGVVLVLFGVFVIGLVDNIVRPVLVGRDTSLPDWMVLLTTLGGLAVFGANGVVIGPVIAALFLTAWGLFRQSKSTASD